MAYFTPVTDAVDGWQDVDFVNELIISFNERVAVCTARQGSQYVTPLPVAVPGTDIQQGWPFWFNMQRGLDSMMESSDELWPLHGYFFMDHNAVL